MRNLSLDQLGTLIEVVALGIFTEAAKRRHLTQPALIQQIREPENRSACGLSRASASMHRHASGQRTVHAWTDGSWRRWTMRHHKVGTAGRADWSNHGARSPDCRRSGKSRDAYPDIFEGFAFRPRTISWLPKSIIADSANRTLVVDRRSAVGTCLPQAASKRALAREDPTIK